jgi:hypothetical protein
MLALQNGGCASCGDAPGKIRLHVDHDHSTGLVRGLLCVKCNMALGHLDESPAKAMGLIAYMRRACLKVTS